MEKVLEIYRGIATEIGTEGLVLIGITVFLFIVQLVYWAGRYASIPRYRNTVRGTEFRADGISVIVILREEPFWYLETVLPLLLSQDYEEFEIIVVEVGTTEEFSEELSQIREKHNNLVTTRMESDLRFPISGKMAYNVGLKAAKYDRVILTTGQSEPVSTKWLSCMARGFSNGEVVIGYAGLENKKGLARGIMRASRLNMSVRYLSSAIKGNPYRGIIHNLGFTRQLYFAHKGFDYLNMDLGEDDLFIQRIAVKGNTSIVMNPHATVRESVWGGLDWWWNMRRRFSSTYKFYPARVRIPIGWELWSRFLFFIAIAVCVWILPMWFMLGAVVLLLLRLAIVMNTFRRIRRRLGEKGMRRGLIVYDFLGPFSEFFLSLSRRLRPAPGIWR